MAAVARAAARRVVSASRISRDDRAAGNCRAVDMQALSKALRGAEPALQQRRSAAAMSRLPCGLTAAMSAGGVVQRLSR
jgi:hypothetical protein